MFRSSIKIADILVQMESNFPLEKFNESMEQELIADRFKNFLYYGNQKPDISINVKIVDKLPLVTHTKPLFITYHFQDNSENWRLLKQGKNYVYKSPIEDKKQLIIVNENFNRVTAYLIPKSGKNIVSEKRKAFIKKHNGKVWNITDIIYDFLQVLLINYFAQRKLGIFVHAIGLGDLKHRGLLFAGKSGAGKTTMAKLWYNNSKAMILNDDRVIVRKIGNDFFIYGSPWHGEFSDYLSSRMESEKLAQIFFIHHSPKNKSRSLLQGKSFKLLYPAIFPTFWDKNFLENITSFSQDLIKHVPCFKLGFINDKNIIGFVRKTYGCKKD